jgi:hypothetical protein
MGRHREAEPSAVPFREPLPSFFLFPFLSSLSPLVVCLAAQTGAVSLCYPPLSFLILSELYSLLDSLSLAGLPFLLHLFGTLFLTPLVALFHAFSPSFESCFIY